MWMALLQLIWWVICGSVLTWLIWKDDHPKPRFIEFLIAFVVMAVAPIVSFVLLNRLFGQETILGRVIVGGGTMVTVPIIAAVWESYRRPKI